MKRSVQGGGPPLSDKTFSSALKRLLKAGFLEKESTLPRSLYRLNIPLREQDFRSAMLASDIQRLEMAVQVGCHGELLRGYAIYAVDPNAPRVFLRDLTEIAESSRVSILEAAYQATDELIEKVNRILVRARIDRYHRNLVRAFLDRARDFRIEMGNIPAIAAYGKGVETLLGPEFSKALLSETPKLAAEAIRRKWANPERHIKRFFKPIVRMTESDEPFLRGLALIFYDPARLVGEEMARFRSTLRKAGIRYSELQKLSGQWFVLMKSLRPTMVVSA